MSELSYIENTDTSVNITWKPPKEPNGVIIAYIVEHGVYNKKSLTSVEIDASRSRQTVIQALGMYCCYSTYIVAFPIYDEINKLLLAIIGRRRSPLARLAPFMIMYSVQQVVRVCTPSVNVHKTVSTNDSESHSVV